jgi:hypothetical protein
MCSTFGRTEVTPRCNQHAGVGSGKPPLSTLAGTLAPAHSREKQPQKDIVLGDIFGRRGVSNHDEHLLQRTKSLLRTHLLHDVMVGTDRPPLHDVMVGAGRPSMARGAELTKFVDGRHLPSKTAVGRWCLASTGVRSAT